MQNTLADLVDKLKNGQYPNEQAIKQGVVLRILGELQWDIYDPKVVWPEFHVNGSFVDFALCYPQGRPLIFIEVKQSNTFNVGEDQLMMRYAFQHGVPIAILTDGQRWSFYLPGGAGSFEERRFYHLDLLERSLEEVQSQFERYLAFKDVKAGRAAEAARADHDDAARKRAITTALPKAWKELVQEADARLVEALLEKVETTTGYRPQESEAVAFLQQGEPPSGAKIERTIIRKTPLAPRPAERVVPGKATTPFPATNNPDGNNWYSINGQEKVHSVKAIDTTIDSMRELANLNPQILEDVESSLLKKNGRKPIKRRIIARSQKDLYERQEFLSQSVEIISGWWLGTNYSNRDKSALLSVAQSAAAGYGISFEFHLA